MIFDLSPQGSDAWLAARRGAITGSRFSNARDRLKSGKPSAAMLGYAQDLARERCGGLLLPTFATPAMRIGTEQEPAARAEYELMTGNVVTEAGLILTDDRRFGVSVDGLVGDDGLIEIKTMCSSATLFRAAVDGDVSEYLDQINGALWLLRREWCDLCLWVPDMQRLIVRRIERDEDAIEALEVDLIAFRDLVDNLTDRLRAVVGND